MSAHAGGHAALVVGSAAMSNECGSLHRGTFSPPPAAIPAPTNGRGPGRGMRRGLIER